ncbi:FAD-dependent thymidylate synthase, partial [Escherichia coli]|uniref:FAD-dependent thymidylate synthase n=1 Tax=Escherichia coli TaxID=562 RepID=UPI0021D7E3FE
MRHRTFTYSQLSMRYSKFDGDCYLPEVEDIRVQVGKPMEYRFAKASKEIAEETQLMMADVYEHAFQTYV